jgi:hypothetical protein
MDISTAWEITGENIAFSAEKILGNEDRQGLQHTHQNLHTTDGAKKPIIST